MHTSVTDQFITDATQIAHIAIATRKKRNNAGLRQTDLAELLKVSSSQIGVIESGKANAINRDHVKKLAKIFQCHTRDLIGRTKFPPLEAPVIHQLSEHESQDFQDFVHRKKTDLELAEAEISLLNVALDDARYTIKVAVAVAIVSFLFTLIMFINWIS